MNAPSDKPSELTTDILIVGTGFAGVGMAIRLKQTGLDDFLLLEQASEIGGTWRDNHYPGAACDVKSHLYSFSFEPNPKWTRMFAEQREIQAYMLHCVEKYQLRPRVRFNMQVSRAEFDEQRGAWRVHTSDGTVINCRAVISGCGGLSRPSKPDIPGLESFQGECFHSANWNHDYALEGKTVGVIGTGASAIQFVPQVVKRAEKLRLFQRTPPWILPKPDRAITRLERRVFKRIPAAQQAYRQAIYWTTEVRATAFVVKPQILKFAERFALAHLKRSVRDADLRQRLTPNYSMGCKRILMSNDYYAALQQPNLELVTSGIQRVTPTGVITQDGQERKLDALILGTGFSAAEAAAPFEIRGRKGQDLAATWESGAEAYLGTTVSGFPNLFTIVGPNTGLGHSSMVFMIESQIAYILSSLRAQRTRNLKFMDVRRDVQDAFNQRLQQRMAGTVWNSGCTSWYQTSSGKNTTLWPGFTIEFRAKTRRIKLSDYELVERDAREPVRRPASAQPALASA